MAACQTFHKHVNYITNKNYSINSSIDFYRKFVKTKINI